MPAAGGHIGPPLHEIIIDNPVNYSPFHSLGLLPSAWVIRPLSSSASMMRAAFEYPMPILRCKNDVDIFPLSFARSHARLNMSGSMPSSSVKPFDFGMSSSDRKST